MIASYGEIEMAIFRDHRRCALPFQLCINCAQLWLLKLGTQKMLGGTDVLCELCDVEDDHYVHVFVSFIIKCRYLICLVVTRTATHLFVSNV